MVTQYKLKLLVFKRGRGLPTGVFKKVVGGGYSETDLPSWGGWPWPEATTPASNVEPSRGDNPSWSRATPCPLFHSFSQFLTWCGRTLFPMSVKWYLGLLCISWTCSEIERFSYFMLVGLWCFWKIPIICPFFCVPFSSGGGGVYWLMSVVYTFCVKDLWLCNWFSVWNSI